MNRNPFFVSRRVWLKQALHGTAAMALMPSIIPASALGQGARPAPSNRLTMGMMGLGSMGMRHILGFLQEPDCQITAVCDVDSARRLEAIKVTNLHYGDQGCAQDTDFRDMIARKDLDVLCIALPDHWHLIPSVMAVRAGKDIYGEKPLALTIREGRIMVEAVNRYGCIWETGTQSRSDARIRFACQLVRNRRIGKLERVEVGLPAGPRIGPQPEMPVPEGFDYDLWLGPAPWAPYTQRRCHWDFRWILDYSGGQLTDQGAHSIDVAQWGAGTEETGPVEVEGTGEFPTQSLWDAAVTYHVELRFANGISMGIGTPPHFRGGVRWIGDKGWVHSSGSNIETNPKRLLWEQFGPGEIQLYQSAGGRQGHRRNFLDCVKARTQPASTIEVAHRSITLAHLGNIAMRLGRKIRWNPETEQILDDPTAARMLGRPFRSPWTL
jgi:predicted dehydrogenase